MMRNTPERQQNPIQNDTNASGFHSALPDAAHFASRADGYSEGNRIMLLAGNDRDTRQQRVLGMPEQAPTRPWRGEQPR